MSNPTIKAIQKIAGESVYVRTGVCLSGSLRSTGVVTVSLDNDPAGTPVSAVTVNGPLQIGQRVALLAYPPRGLIVLGPIGGLPGLSFLEKHDSTAQPTYVSAVATLGSPLVGFTFVAPASGTILLEVSTAMDVAGMRTTTNVGGKGRVFARVYSGPTIGSGTATEPSPFWDGDVVGAPLIIFENQKTAGAVPGTTASTAGGSGQSPVTGLTPNKTYNVSLWYRLDNTTDPSYSMFVYNRRVTGLLVT